MTTNRKETGGQNGDTLPTCARVSRAHPRSCDASRTAQMHLSIGEIASGPRFLEPPHHAPIAVPAARRGSDRAVG